MGIKAAAVSSQTPKLDRQKTIDAFKNGAIQVLVSVDLFSEGSNVEYNIYEGKKYRIPHNYDVCLRKNYGDYMSLPPKEEQVGHPQIAYWK